MNDDLQTSDPQTAPELRRSPWLAVAGLLAIAVGAWGVAGGPDLPDLTLLPWVLIGVGVVAGVVLIASGLRRPSS